jgi:hypothetical protein
MKNRLLGVVIVVLLLGACAHLPPSQNPNRVAELIELVNTAEPGELAGRCQRPFLFHDELVAREADIELIWSSMREAGIQFAADGEPLPAERGDYHRLAETFDLRVFFSGEGYLPDDAVWIPLATPAGAFDLLVGGESGRLPMILGIVRVDR